MMLTKHWPISFTREQLQMGLAEMGTDPEMNFLFSRALQNLDERNSQEKEATKRVKERFAEMARRRKEAFEKKGPL